MSLLKKTTIVVFGTVASAMFLAFPASAGPAEDVCTMAGVPFCGFLPGVSDIDRAIDTTTGPIDLNTIDLNNLGLDNPERAIELCGSFCR